MRDRNSTPHSDVTVIAFTQSLSCLCGELSGAAVPIPTMPINTLQKPEDQGLQYSVQLCCVSTLLGIWTFECTAGCVSLLEPCNMYVSRSVSSNVLFSVSLCVFGPPVCPLPAGSLGGELSHRGTKCPPGPAYSCCAAVLQAPTRDEEAAWGVALCRHC